MKLGLNAKLTLGIVLVFGLVLAGYYFYDPLYFKWYEWKLCSKDAADVSDAVSKILSKYKAAKPHIEKWLDSPNDRLAIGACMVLENSAGEDWRDFLPVLRKILGEVPSDRTNAAAAVMRAHKYGWKWELVHYKSNIDPGKSELKCDTGFSLPEERNVLHYSALKDPDADIRCVAIVKIGMKREKRDTPLIKKVLEDDANILVRGYAAWALVEIAGKDAFNPLMSALKNHSDEKGAACPLCKAVSEGIVYLKCEKILLALRALLETGDAHFRNEILGILIEMKDAAVAGPLLERLKQTYNSDAIDEIAMKLGALGDPAAFDAVRAIMDRDIDCKLNSGYIQALANINKNRACDYFLEELRNKSNYEPYKVEYYLSNRENFFRAVAETGTDNAIDSLIRFAESKTPAVIGFENGDYIYEQWQYIRQVCVELLDCIRDRRAVPALTAIMFDNSNNYSSLQERAAEALGRMGAIGSCGPLIDVVATCDPEGIGKGLMWSAIYSLNRLGDPAAQNVIMNSTEMLEEGYGWSSSRGLIYNSMLLGLYANASCVPWIFSLAEDNGNYVEYPEIVDTICEVGGPETAEWLQEEFKRGCDRMVENLFYFNLFNESKVKEADKIREKQNAEASILGKMCGKEAEKYILTAIATGNDYGVGDEGNLIFEWLIFTGGGDSAKFLRDILSATGKKGEQPKFFRTLLTDEMETAAYALGYIDGENALDVLIPILQDKEIQYPESAAKGIYVAGGKRAGDALLKAIKYEDAEWVGWENWAGYLEKSGAEGIFDAVLPHIHEKNYHARLFAVRMLGVSGDPRAIDVLDNILMCEPDEGVRYEAVIGIGCVNHPRAIRILRSLLLEDRSYDIRAAAAYILGYVRCVDAVPYLVKALEKEHTEKNLKNIAIALGNIGSTEGAGALCGLLENASSWKVRAAAADALGKIENSNSEEILIKTVSQDENEDVRIAAAAALCGSDSPELRARLEKLRDSGNRLAALPLAWMRGGDDIRIAVSMCWPGAALIRKSVFEEREADPDLLLLRQPPSTATLKYSKHGLEEYDAYPKSYPLLNLDGDSLEEDKIVRFIYAIKARWGCASFIPFILKYLMAGRYHTHEWKLILEITKLMPDGFPKYTGYETFRGIVEVRKAIRDWIVENISRLAWDAEKKKYYLKPAEDAK